MVVGLGAYGGLGRHCWEEGRTVLLGVELAGRGPGRGYHLPGLLCNFYEQVMDFSKVGFGHGGRIRCWSQLSWRTFSRIACLEGQLFEFELRHDVVGTGVDLHVGRDSLTIVPSSSVADFLDGS